MKTKTTENRKAPTGSSRPRRAGRARIPGNPRVTTAHLELEFPGARCVELAGSFNNWNPAQDKMTRMEDGRWVKDIPLKAGTYEYRFVVDGRWIPDPRAERAVTNPFGEVNSLLFVPEAGGQRARASSGNE